MARITFGLASSHGPLLSTPPDQWLMRAAADRQNPAHAFRGGTYSFDDLVALRAHEHLDQHVVPAERARRHAACQDALTTLGRRFADQQLDVVVMIGNDQREIFTEQNTPALSVFHGDAVENVAVSKEYLAKMPPGLAVAHWANVPEETVTYPCVPALGEHLIASLVRDQFDVAAMKTLPEGPSGRRGLPHAFGFLYRRIMNDVPVAAVPIVLNTFYPPNQPTVERCFDFGRAVGRAIASWPGDERIGVMMSGGLSHFVIDEELDRAVLDAMRAKSRTLLRQLPADRFRSGTSETKNWIAGIGLLAESALEMDLVDYVACYRSEAGTGNAMAFATWQ